MEVKFGTLNFWKIISSLCSNQLALKMATSFIFYLDLSISILELGWRKSALKSLD